MAEEETVMSYLIYLSVLETQLGGIGRSVEESENRRAVLKGLTDEFSVIGERNGGIDTSLTEATAMIIVKERT